jgi:hypothetical protein
MNCIIESSGEIPPNRDNYKKGYGDYVADQPDFPNAFLHHPPPN